MADKKSKYVLLRGIEYGNRFFSWNDQKSDPTKSSTGETWYEILGYADTTKEAQIALYGRHFLLDKEE